MIMWQDHYRRSCDFLTSVAEYFTMLSHFSFRDKCIFPCSFSGTAPSVEFESVEFSAGRMVKKAGAVQPEYHVNDYLCSVRVVTDADGEVLERNDYSGYGKRLASSTGSANRYRFSGKEEQTFAGVPWQDFGARMYDHDLARWTTPDPLAEKYPGISPYVYCNSNPVNFVDPDGEHPVVVGAIIGGAVSGTAAVINGKSFTEVVAATAGGAVDGALTALGGKSLKIVSKFLLGAGGGSLGDLVEQGLNVAFGNQEQINGIEVGISATVGAVATGVSGSISKGLENIAEQTISSRSTYETVEKEVKTMIKNSGRSTKSTNMTRLVEKEIDEMKKATSTAIDFSTETAGYAIGFYNEILIEDER